MITPVNRNLSRATARTTAPVKQNPAARRANFGRVLGNQNAPVVASSNAIDPGVKHLGPMFDNTILGPTNPPARKPSAAPAAVTAAPPTTTTQEVSGIPQGLINFTNRAMHEQTMNNWLQTSIQSANDQKMQIYNQAMANWKLNESRYRDLGLPVPPQPQPPALDPVAPMPKGWWFEDTRV